MPASISSNFYFVLDELIQNEVRILTNPGRTFRIVSVQVGSGVNGGSIDIANTGTGLTAASGPPIPATYESDFPCRLLVANLDFAATDDIIINETANVAVNRVLIICEALNPQPISVTLVA